VTLKWLLGFEYDKFDYSEGGLPGADAGGAGQAKASISIPELIVLGWAMRRSAS
jgi:hypothetical protein